MAHQIEAKRQRRVGWLYLSLWAILIALGIVAKRAYGHPDWMVFFHLPAAVMLVMAFHRLSAEFRLKYRDSLRSRALTRNSVQL